MHDDGLLRRDAPRNDELDYFRINPVIARRAKPDAAIHGLVYALAGMDRHGSGQPLLRASR